MDEQRHEQRANSLLYTELAEMNIHHFIDELMRSRDLLERHESEISELRARLKHLESKGDDNHLERCFNL